jgi:hypothetical protein
VETKDGRISFFIQFGSKGSKEVAIFQNLENISGANRSNFPGMSSFKQLASDKLETAGGW